MFKYHMYSSGGIEMGVHIGLSQTGNDGSYRWSDGTRATHLPDNMDKPAAAAAFCVMLEQVTWRHVAVDCEHHVAALCQRSPYSKGSYGPCQSV